MKKLLSISVFILAFFISNSQEVPKWKIDQLESYIQKAEYPTIINFWATFCKPCIEEIPSFQKLVKNYKGDNVQLLLVSLDLPEAYNKIRPFAVKRKITAPVIFLDETNADLFCPKVDEQWSGAIPASLFINPKTGYRKFIEDQLTETKAEHQIRAMLTARPLPPSF